MIYRFRSALAMDLPKSNPASSVGGGAGFRTLVPEQDSPATEPPLQTTPPQNNVASRSSTDTHVPENDIATCESTIAETQELAEASSALLAVTHKMSTAHDQVRLRA